jgi:hypothetical protein
LGVCSLAGKLEKIKKPQVIIEVDGDLGEIRTRENLPVVLASPKWKLMAKMKKRALQYEGCKKSACMDVTEDGECRVLEQAR